MSGRGAGPAPSTLVPQRLDRLREFGERRAYLWRDGVRWRERTFATLHRRIEAAAGRLAGAGVGPGVPVLIQGPHHPDWVEALLATLLLGGTAVPLDEGTPESFRSEVARRSGGSLLVAPRAVSPPPGGRRIDLGDWPEGEASRASFNPAAADPARIAEIVFTSGTTGEPRGVVLTHGNLFSDFAPLERAFLRYQAPMRWLREIRCISTLPLSHMFGQAMNVFLSLYMGLTIVLVPTRPREVLEAARRTGAWGLFTVPRLLDLLSGEIRRLLREEGCLERYTARQERLATRPFYLQFPAFPRIRRRFGWKFILLVSGGAGLPESLQRFYERYGFLVVQGYGLTETAPIVSISNPFERRSGSVGRPLGIQEVKLGPDGEVLVRGPNVTSGYLGAAPGAEDGWFHTGDAGEFDEGGRLRIRGRLKDVIVTAEGENVYPADVEAALLRQPGILEACVLGVPAGGGEQVHAVLRLEAGADAEAAVADANRALQPRQRIRGHTRWEEEDWPRTPTGKIRKGVLRARILAAMSGAPEAAGPGSSVSQRARHLVARLARVNLERVEENTRLVEGLGFASLDLVELAAAVEEEFGVLLPEEALPGATFGDLERAIAAGSALPAPSPAPAGRPSAAKPGSPPRDPESASTGPPASPVAGEDVAPPELLPADRRGRPGRLRMPRWAFRLPVRILRGLIRELVFRPIVFLYTRPRVTGAERLDSIRLPCLFVSNHQSYLDTGLFQLALPRALRGRIAPAMTTRYHRVFFGETAGSRFRHAIEALQASLVSFLFGAWPLPETVGFRNSLDYAGELADGGDSLLIFPEGRHVPDGKTMAFRGGIGLFARDLRMPVVPAAVAGTRKVLPDQVYWLRFGRTRLALGEPMEFEPDADPAEITRRLEAAVRALQATLADA